MSTKLVPLTTRPRSTSRHGMSRFSATREEYGAAARGPLALAAQRHGLGCGRLGELPGLELADELHHPAPLLLRQVAGPAPGLRQQAAELRRLTRIEPLEVP